jgi:transcriptional regulator with XRE-family HTH domain
VESTTKVKEVAPAVALFRAFRAKAGISQAEAGRQLRVSGPTVSDWESAEKRPKADVRDRIETWSGGEVPAIEWKLSDERVEQEPCVPKRSGEAA